MGRRHHSNGRIHKNAARSFVADYKKAELLLYINEPKGWEQHPTNPSFYIKPFPHHINLSQTNTREVLKDYHGHVIRLEEESDDYIMISTNVYRERIEKTIPSHHRVTYTSTTIPTR